jgi:hypothetical protein
VIATGFREVPAMRRRQQEVHNSFAAAHAEMMDFPESEPAPSPRFEPDPVPDRIMMHDAPMAAPEPVGLAQVEPEANSIDVVRSTMTANFEPDNLDVPAFLRKRGEIM